MSYQAGLLVAHALLTAMMTGVIWFVQILHYPLMRRLGRDSFVEYEREHTRLAGLMIAPLMIAELATAGLVLLATLTTPLATGLIVNLGALVAIWALTFLVSVPLHRKLCDTFDQAVLRRLIQTNWWRTALWTVRTILLGWLTLRVFG